MAALHDLILCQSTSVLSTLHNITVILVSILDVRQAKRPATVLVSCELGCRIVSISLQSKEQVRTNGSFSVCTLLKFDDTSATRSAVGLILDLSTRYLANRSEKLNQVLVAGGPRQVADIDEVTGFTTRSGKVGEGIRGVGRTVRVKTRPSGWSSRTTIACIEPSTSSKASAKAATSAESPTSAKTSTEAATASEATASSKASVARKTVFANLEVTTLPLVAVELSDGVPSIIYSLESNDTRALWSAIWSDVNIGTKDRAGMSGLTEEVFQILPANIVR